jgi:hypothetical protein
VNFSLSHSKDMNYPKEKTIMVRPCISVVANVEGFTLYKDGLHPFHIHYVVFEVIV